MIVATDRSTANSICEHAKEIGADLIIISTHGRTGLRHLLIGSVAEKVVRGNDDGLGSGNCGRDPVHDERRIRAAGF